MNKISTCTGLAKRHKTLQYPTILVTTAEGTHRITLIVVVLFTVTHNIQQAPSIINELWIVFDFIRTGNIIIATIIAAVTEIVRI